MEVLQWIKSKRFNEQNINLALFCLLSFNIKGEYMKKELHYEI